MKRFYDQINAYENKLKEQFTKQRKQKKRGQFLLGLFTVLAILLFWFTFYNKSALTVIDTIKDFSEMSYEWILTSFFEYEIIVVE